MAQIELRNLCKRWGNFVGVDNVNLTIADREFLVLLGPSGCGKTTTMRMIAGLEDVSSGEIRIDGKLINELEPKDRDVAMVFQSYALYPNMNVYENIRFPLKVRKIDPATHDERVKRASAMVELDDFLHRKPAELSGGQRQRVALARAVVREPNAFLMDEPLSNLDAKLRVSTRAQIKNLCHELAVTTIYVTHDQIEAMTLADRVVVMKAGVVQQVGTPTEIYDNPGNAFVASFIGSPAMNLVEGKVEGGVFKAQHMAVPGIDVQDGPITLGFRAEDADLAPDAAGQINAPVYTLELLGDATMISVRLDGVLVSVKADKNFRINIGDPVSIAIEPRFCHLLMQGQGRACRVSSNSFSVNSRWGHHGDTTESTLEKNHASEKLTLATALVLSANAAYAGCGVTAGRVNIVGNEFPAIHTVVKGAEACAGDGVTVTANLTADHQKINLAGMQGDPAEYTSAIIANSSIVALINADVLRPLDDLIAKHGQDIPKSNLITIDGKVMAVAFMANAQHLAYRKDVLEQIGVEPPETYEALLDAARMIREKGIMENPVGGAYMAGWNLAQEFVNMYIGYGGEFYKPGTAEVSINNAQGIAALEMLKSLTEYMNPDYLTHDSNATGAEVEAGNVALMNFWGSRMGKLMDDEGAEEVVYSNLAVAGPLTVGDGTIPATTLWWDGWTVAKNISDEDAEATFLAMKNGTSPGILNEETMGQAVWMIEGYTPAPVNDGVFAAIKASAKPYPMLPYHGLLHTALGDNLSDYLQGKESAEAALADAEAAYTTAAKEKGFLN